MPIFNKYLQAMHLNKLSLTLNKLYGLFFSSINVVFHFSSQILDHAE